MESRVKCMDTIHALSAGKVSETGLDEIARLPHGPGDEQFSTVLNGFLLKLEGDPIFSMLELKLNPGETLADLFNAIKVSKRKVKCGLILSQAMYEHFRISSKIWQFLLIMPCRNKIARFAEVPIIISATHGRLGGFFPLEIQVSRLSSYTGRASYVVFPLGTDCDTSYFRLAPASELSAYKANDLELCRRLYYRYSPRVVLSVFICIDSARLEGLQV